MLCGLDSRTHRRKVRSSNPLCSTRKSPRAGAVSLLVMFPGHARLIDGFFPRIDVEPRQCGNDAQQLAISVIAAAERRKCCVTVHYLRCVCIADNEPSLIACQGNYIVYDDFCSALSDSDEDES